SSTGSVAVNFANRSRPSTSDVSTSWRPLTERAPAQGAPSMPCGSTFSLGWPVACVSASSPAKPGHWPSARSSSRSPYKQASSSSPQPFHTAINFFKWYLGSSLPSAPPQPCEDRHVTTISSQTSTGPDPLLGAPADGA